MKINQSNKSLQVTKAEEDSTTASQQAKKTQPGNLDSFEKATPKAPENQSAASGSAEPIKKAGSNTQKILMTKLDSARLLERGVKSGSMERKEMNGEKGLGTDQENAANKLRGNLTGIAQNGTSTENANADGANGGDGKSRHEQMSERVKGFFGEQGPSNSGPSGGSFPPGFSPRSAAEMNQALTGGSSGPGNPLDSMNEAYQRRSNMANVRSKNAAVSEMIDGLTPDTSESDQSGYGKDGIMQSAGVGYGAGYDAQEGVKGGSTTTAAKNPGMDRAVKTTYVSGGVGSAREYGLLSGEDDFNPKDYTRSDGSRVQTGNDGTVVVTAKDGTKSVTTPDGTKTTVYPDGSTKTEKPGAKTETTPPLEDKDKKKKSDSNSSGAPDAKDADPEKYVDPGAERAKQKMDELNNFLGINTAHVGPPKIQGDVDPDPEAIPRSGSAAESAFQSKFQWVGQPGPDQEYEAGPSHGGDPYGPGGGDVDYEDGSGYQGPNRTSDPEDVNVGIGAGMKTEASEDEENDENKQKKNKRLIGL